MLLLVREADVRVRRGGADLAPFRPLTVWLRMGEIGHNKGPRLDDFLGPPWGPNGIGNYFDWKAATEAAFGKVPGPIAIRRARLAEKIGLTYVEYQLEILERGRYLQPTDTDRILEIKSKREVRW